MDIPSEIDDYVKESIDHSLGLPVSTHTLELKLRASEDAQRRLHNRCLHLQAKLQEKENLLERVRVRTLQLFKGRVCVFFICSFKDFSFSFPLRLKQV
jgi:hypothetical protein